MVSLSIYGLSVWYIVLSNTCRLFFAIFLSCIATIKLLKFLRYFQRNLLLHFTDMPFLKRNEKVNCKNCGTQTTRLNLARHRKKCSAGSLKCSSCTNFSTKSRAERNDHIAKKHSEETARVVNECRISDKYFDSFYNLQEHKWKEHGGQRVSGSQSVDVAHFMGDVDDISLMEELETCRHFLFESEMENWRHRV